MGEGQLFRFILLLSVIALSLPAFADETYKQLSSNQTSTDDTPNDEQLSDEQPNDTEDNIESDSQLLSREFSGYRSLLNRRFGLLLGIGQLSPSNAFHLELSYAPLKFLRLSMSVSTTSTMSKDTEDMPDTKGRFAAAAFHVRHHLTIIPLFLGAIIGGSKGSIKGTTTQQSAGKEFDYRSTSIYGGLLVGAYYFWNFGLYLETTVIGFSYHYALNKSFAEEDDIDDKELEQKLNKRIVGPRFFGWLDGKLGLNIAIGYML